VLEAVQAARSDSRVIVTSRELLGQVGQYLTHENVPYRRVNESFKLGKVCLPSSLDLRRIALPSLKLSLALLPYRIGLDFSATGAVENAAVGRP
jgi:hypothetical protein